MRILADISELQNWTHTARAGDVLPYFRGHLAMAADTSVAAREIAQQVTWLYSIGLVIPVQQRVGKHDYRYFLQRTAQPAEQRRLAA